MPKHRPDSATFFDRLSSITASVLTARAAAQLAEPARQDIAQAVASQVRREFAGRDFYVPADQDGAMGLRNAAIRAGFMRDGSDGAAAGSAARAAQLAREHKLSVRRVRAILATAKSGAQA